MWKSILMKLTLLLVLTVANVVACEDGDPDSTGASENATVDAPLPPEHAAASMIVPDGFHVTLFAGEPDVQQPIGFCIDDRGRLWVAEAYNYPNHGTKPGDRIVIFEDSDGDGKFDKRSVFYDQLNYVTGIEVGFGGVWVMSPPSLYFISDNNGDDVPDGPPQVLLDGFGNHANSHNLANGFAWGPDGWLYGTHGRTNYSRIAKPGTPDTERTQFDGGVYRYHPVRHVWEPYADGTTNPWGIDWNDFGDSFVTNCVNPHLFHVIQGAHYEPWRNRESSRFAYERIPTIADHLHFIGGPNVRDGLGSPAEDAAGGGHAHCGTMIYLGDNWPEQYRNSVFTNNIHGKRVNNDLLTREGSGYVASHGQDILRSRDPWHMGVTVQYGPDGGVYISDWSDTGECHSVKNTQRETGRIFKLTYGKPTPAPVNIASLSDTELVKLQLHRNDWHVRHARRVLQERAAKGQDMAQVHGELLAQFRQQSHVPSKLRALWALQVLGAFAEGPLAKSFLFEQLSHESETIRGWSIRFLCESLPSSIVLSRLHEMASTDPSPYVRLQLASALQRLPLSDRWKIAASLIQHGEDSEDMNLPFMYWYAIEPLIDNDLRRFLGLSEVCKIPMVCNHIARRATSHSRSAEALETLTQSLAENQNAAIQLELVNGMMRGMEGRRSVRMPANWTKAFTVLETSSERKMRLASIELALVFGDPRAVVSLRTIAVDKKADATYRTRALRSLVVKKSQDVAVLLLMLVDDPDVRREAIRGLAEFDEPSTAETLLSKYASFDSESRQDVLQTLASRPSWGSTLLDAIQSNRIAAKDVSAFTARQLHSLGDSGLAARVVSTWGAMRSTSADKAKQIVSYKKLLTQDTLIRADLSNGKSLFQKNCANCHRLFGEGGTIGPEITGSQRTNLEYMLENLIDPSASVAKDFQMELIQTDSGRVITGLVVDETERAITMQTANERVVLPKSEVEERSVSKLSMMPDGLLQSLSKEQVRDLIGYLASPAKP